MLKTYKNYLDKSGFTLVEMLIVVAIIGVLGTMTFIAINPSRLKSRDARRTADVNSILQAVVQYQDDHNSNAPDGTNGLNCLIGNSACADPDIAYLNKLPSDPVNTAPHVYTYSNSGNDKTFYVKFVTEGPATHLDSAATGAGGNTFCLTSSGIEFSATGTGGTCTEK